MEKTIVLHASKPKDGELKEMKTTNNDVPIIIWKSQTPLRKNAYQGKHSYSEPIRSP